MLFLFILPLSRLWGESITIPGDVNAISFYTKFFYNLPGRDFIYYFNDRLLFSENPDGSILSKGFRNDMLKLLQVHGRIKEFIKESKSDSGSRITLDLKTSSGFGKAGDLFSLLGLHLEKDKEGKFLVYVDDSSGVSDYYKFAMLDVNNLAKQLNKTLLFYFELKESEVSIPWNLEFLQEITALELEPSTFFENLIKDERLSLLLGILYRLTPKEIDFISSLVKKPQQAAWKRIYQDKQFLVGLFVLSAALRVEDNRLVLPGGEKAEDFWYNLTGEDYLEYPFEFLEELVTAQEGKLNYLYLFSFFLPESSRQALFFDYDAEKVQGMLDHVHLSRGEKLGLDRFPRLRDFNFFTLLYSLRVKDGQIYFPAGASAWLRVIKNQVSPTGKGVEQREGADLAVELITTLLKGSGKNSKGKSDVQKFMSLYTKFFNRPQLLSEEVMAVLYNNYEEYNVLVDFIEKIPIQKPETVLNLFEWVKTFGGINRKDRAIYTAIFQSLLEIFSHSSKYAPTNFDYDRLVAKMTAIPMTKSLFFNEILGYFANELGLRLNRETIDEAFLDFVLAGVGNQTLRIRDIDYRYLAKDLWREQLKEILQSQEVCSLSGLLEINTLLRDILQGRGIKDAGIEGRIRETFLLLPHPDMSLDAPQVIRQRVVIYSKASLNRDINHLVNLLKGPPDREKLEQMVNKIRGDYLLPHLEDYLLALSYALNAKNPELRFFLNPNLIRLHDFEGDNGHTPWNFCGRPVSRLVPKKRSGIFGNKETETFSGYYLRGGLSRLNIVLSSIWKDHLFGRSVIYDPEHVKSFLTNLLDFYPVPLLQQSQAFAALLVEFALEMIQKSEKDEKIRQEVMKELGTITTGYHYRRIWSYLNGEEIDYYLFFNELMSLGERFFKQKKHLSDFSARDRLEAFYKEPLNKIVLDNMDQLGSIYYHTFGSLKPYRLDIFPQEVSNFFTSGWTSGEMINEFKIKAAYHAYKREIPPYLLGEILYQYLNDTSKRYYSQNYEKDYFSTYFIFDIFNNSHLSRILKKAQEKGYLRIK